MGASALVGTDSPSWVDIGEEEGEKRVCFLLGEELSLLPILLGRFCSGVAVVLVIVDRPPPWIGLAIRDMTELLKEKAEEEEEQERRKGEET